MSDFGRAFEFMGDNLSLLLSRTGQHLVISGIAVGIALAIALPLGVWLGHVRRFSFLAISVSNIGRALPSLAVICIALPVLGVGRTTVIFALVVLAVPIVLTNAYVGVSEVDPEAVEAATGMGMRASEVLRRVELPLAVPLLFAGIRTATVYVIATATLGGYFAGGGLGDIIADQATYRLPGVLAAAIWVAGLAVLAELALGVLQRAVTPRGLRAEGAPALGPATGTA